MGDDKTKKKLDRTRVNLSQNYEIRSLRDSAKSVLERLKKFKNSEVLEIIRFDKVGSGNHHKIKQVLSIRRICKALLKLTKRK